MSLWVSPYQHLRSYVTLPDVGISTVMNAWWSQTPSCCHIVTRSLYCFLTSAILMLSYLHQPVQGINWGNMCTETWEKKIEESLEFFFMRRHRLLLVENLKRRNLTKMFCNRKKFEENVIVLVLHPRHKTLMVELWQLWSRNSRVEKHLAET